MKPKSKRTPMPGNKLVPSPNLIIPPIQVSVRSRESNGGMYGDILVERVVNVPDFSDFGRLDVAIKLREIADQIANTQYGDGDISGAHVLVLMRKKRS